METYDHVQEANRISNKIHSSAHKTLYIQNNKSKDRNRILKTAREKHSYM